MRSRPADEEGRVLDLVCRGAVRRPQHPAVENIQKRRELSRARCILVALSRATRLGKCREFSETASNRAIVIDSDIEKPKPRPLMTDYPGDRPEQRATVEEVRRLS